MGNQFIDFVKEIRGTGKSNSDWWGSLDKDFQKDFSEKVDLFNKKSKKKGFNIDTDIDFSGLSDDVKSYFKNVEAGKASTEGLNKAMSATMKTASSTGTEFLSTGSKIKDFGIQAKTAMKGFGNVVKNGLKSFGGMALGIGANVAINAGIGLAINGLIGLWDKYANAQENAIERGKEAAAAIEDNYTSISNASKWQSDSLERFAELSQGVDKTGHNLSLTTAEFSEYQSLASELANIVPDLAVGFNDLGDPIIKAATNVDKLNEAFRANEVEKYQENIKSAEDVIKAFKTQYDEAGSLFKEAGFGQKQAAYKDILDAYNKLGITGTNFWKNQGLTEALTYKGYNGFALEDALNDLGIKNINDNSIIKGIEKIEEAYQKGEAALQEYGAQVRDSLASFLMVNDDYYELTKSNSNIDALLDSIISGLDDSTINEYLGSTDQIESWVNSITKGLQNTDVQNAINGLFEIDEDKADMTFKDYESKVKSFAKTIGDNVEGISAEQVLKSFDLDGAFTDLSATYKKVSDKFGQDIADSLSIPDLELATDIISDEDVDNAKEFSQALQDAKLSADANDSFEQFSSTISSTIENLQTMQDILSESASGLSISSENLDAFRSMFGDDAERALERTANGYHINRQALAELQEQQNESIRTDYLSSLNAQYDELRKINEDLAKTALIGGDVSGLLTQKEGIESQISALQDLQMEYQAANSAYQQWINAQSSTNERDMYEKIQSGYETTKDSIERGWVDDDVRTYVDLLSNMDLATASAQEVVAEFNRLGESIGNSGYSILDFFTVDEDGNPTTDGIYNFFDTVNSVLGEEFAKINENGDYEFDFGDGKDQEVADALKMDVEAVQAILRAATDAGFEVHLDQPIESLEELRASAEAAKESLSGMNDTTLSDINLDSSSLEDVNNQIQKTQEYIEAVENNETIDPNVQTDKIEAANDILDYLVLKKQELTETTEIQVELNDEEVLQLLESDNEKLKELGKTKVTFDFEADLSEISSQISEAQSLVEQFQNDKGVVDLSVEGATEAVSILQALLSRKEQLSQPAVMAIDTSQVDGDLGAAIGKIQEFQQALSDLNVAQGLADAGVDIDTSAAQQKVQDLAGQIQNLDGNTKASLGLDTSEFDTALSTIQNQKVDVQAGVNLDQASLSTISSSISAISPEILVKAGVDPAAVDAYDPADKDAEVKYTVNAAEVNAYDPPDKGATVIYSPDTSGLPTSFSAITRTVKYEATGDVGVNGTAHAEGTANASGNWGIKRGGTSLVGELGQEILVRDSKFYTIGDKGAEFIKTKPGDIIFNHKIIFVAIY